MNDKDELVYYYCDIIDTVFDKESNSYTFVDLLADVIIYPDGKVKVVDIEEIADALDEGLIDIETSKKALRRLGKLLDIVYEGKLFDLVSGYLGDF